MRMLAAHEVVELGFEGFYTYTTKKLRQQVTREEVKDKYEMYVEVYGIYQGL